MEERLGRWFLTCPSVRFAPVQGKGRHTFSS
jgi:hypothetical protein